MGDKGKNIYKYFLSSVTSYSILKGIGNILIIQSLEGCGKEFRLCSKYDRKPWKSFKQGIHMIVSILKKIILIARLTINQRFHDKRQKRSFSS